MSKMTTRVGPVIVTHIIFDNGQEINTVVDANDDNMYLVFHDQSFDEAIVWASEYVRARYPRYRFNPLIGVKDKRRNDAGSDTDTPTEQAQ